ncbi:ferritin [Caminicella sporogenes DSM 14501]|uniref:Ferritin n=1 Tax=Caminicella sporogenes DSM 14501 TaxID=1121266 RepID=A0A1M6MJ94_9FIRM|nr:ferritin [Caminicella sporogenes]RKD27533.1 ferritin [Caminicella sporogenes]WIF94892.1 ferritin [Caminicella sporogenes]SHJ83353.1 ferritin [Caminicella sporogenes DSM 14501]
MVSEKLINQLNEQMNFEFLSANYYLAMAAYCASIDLNGFENFFLVQAEEERFHAMKFYNYINEVDGRVVISAYDEPKNEFKSLEDLLESALEHEKVVTDRVYKLMDIAQEEKEYGTINFLKWFVDEQIEEMNMFKKLIKQVKMIGTNGNGLLMLDRELAQRTFTPPTDSN